MKTQGKLCLTLMANLFFIFFVTLDAFDLGFRVRDMMGKNPASDLKMRVSPTGPQTNIGRRTFLQNSIFGGAIAGVASFSASPAVVHARPEGVNKPELLPKEPTNVIDTVKMLTKGEANRLDRILTALEKDTGYKVRVLCQSYPNTPGLAIKDFWGVDEKTIILVADEGTYGKRAASGPANLLNFNVGEGLKFALPNQFWVRLQSKFGNKFYVQEAGKDQAVISAVETIAYCLRQNYCIDIPKELQSLDKVKGF